MRERVVLLLPIPRGSPHPISPLLVPAVPTRLQPLAASNSTLGPPPPPERAHPVPHHRLTPRRAYQCTRPEAVSVRATARPRSTAALHSVASLHSSRSGLTTQQESGRDRSPAEARDGACGACRRAGRTNAPGAATLTEGRARPPLAPNDSHTVRTPKHATFSSVCLDTSLGHYVSLLYVVLLSCMCLLQFESAH